MILIEFTKLIGSIVLRKLIWVLKHNQFKKKKNSCFNLTDIA